MRRTSSTRLKRTAVFGLALSLHVAATAQDASQFQWTDRHRPAAETAVAAKPIYWNKPEFIIPFSVAAQGQPPSSVELEVSTDGGRAWVAVQRSDLSQRQFAFRSPGDGVYWFRIQTLDARGTAVATPTSPMAIVVDTRKPDLDLVVATNESAQMTADFRVADASLTDVSIRLEYQTEQDASWVKVPVQSQYGRSEAELIGEAVWEIPLRAKQMIVRLIVTDAAGNENEITRLPTLMRTANANGGFALAATSQSALAGVASHSNMASASARHGDTLDLAPLPASPFTTGPIAAARPLLRGDEPIDIPAGQPVSTPAATASLPVSPSLGLPAVPGMPPLPSGLAAPPTGGAALSQPVSTAVDPSLRSHREPYASRTRAFSLDYAVDLDSANGIAAVELWGTTDGGKTWTQWGTDPDRNSPFDIKVQTDGLFGFRMVVVGTNGLANYRPVSGEDADAWVQVDTTLPQVAIRSASYGQGVETGSLVVEYSAADERLSPQPIALSYATSVEGPWISIAAAQPNTGRYLWAGNPNLPRQVFLRLEAFDTAGNVAVDVLDLPVDLQGLTPRGRIQGFRPID